MCKYNSISSESWHGADVSCHFSTIICMSVRTGFQSHCRSQFSSSYRTCESHRHFTFSSGDVVTATCGACCRLSGASLLCDLPTEKHSRTLKQQLGKRVGKLMLLIQIWQILQRIVSKLTCISLVRNMWVLSEGVIIHTLYRKERDMVGYHRGWRFTCSVWIVMSALSFNQV